MRPTEHRCTILVALAVLVACGKSAPDLEPRSEPGSAVANEPRFLPVDIVLRRVESATTPDADAIYVVVVGGELRELPAFRLREANGREAIEIDGANRIRVLPTSRRTTIEEVVARAGQVLVIADAATPAKDLLPLVNALESTCWALGVVQSDSGYLAAQWPLPCPAPRNAGRELILTFGPTESTIVIKGVRTTFDGGLGGLRRELRKLAERGNLGYSDLVFAVDDSTSVGEIVDVIALLRGQNFWNPRWLPRDRLPR